MERPDRTWIVSALAVLLLAAPAPCPGAAFTITTGSSFGMMYGLAKEFVYDVSDYNGQPYTLSELDWPLQPLPYARAALTLDTAAGFAASLDLRVGLPGQTGFVEDSDWFNYKDYGDPTKTNYSRHDAVAERAILLDAQAGWELSLAGWVSIEPYLSFGFMDFTWTARDGYVQYPPGYIAHTATLPYPDVSTDPKVPVAGTVIMYQLTYLIPGAGIEATFHAGKAFELAVSFTASPYIFCNDVDNHLISKTDYHDALAGGFLLEPRVSLDWHVTGSMGLSFDAAWRHISGLLGTATAGDTGIGYTPGNVTGTYPNSAGAAFDALDASLSFKLSW